MSDSRKLKSRRSSILKPPKPRNPLSDVDLNPPSDTTLMKSRRVSFANVHFKKEFTADPEKNTIWHTSYEEEMNKSDISVAKNPEQNVASTNADMNMSVEDMSLDSDIMNCTQMVNLDVSLEAPLASNSCDTSITSAIIDLTEHQNQKTPVIGFLQNHNFQEVEQLSFHFSEDIAMEMTQVVDSRRAQVVSTEPSEKENHSTAKRQTIHFNNETEAETMEFTQSVPSHILLNLNKVHETQKRQTINFKNNTMCGNMDETQALLTDIAEIENQCSRKRQTLHFNNETEGATMEFTHSVPPHMLSNLNNVREIQKRQTINFKTNSECGNLDETQGVTTEKENQCSRKRQTLHFNNETEGATMEFTQSVPPQMLLNLNKIHETQKRQTINFKTNTECGNLDETKAISTEIAEKENQCSRKRQTLHFNNETEGATMEFTQSVPAHMLVNINKVRETEKRQTVNFETNTKCGNMDETKAISTEISEKENQCSRKRQTLHFNNETEGATMEFTQSVPAHMLLNLNKVHETQKRQTINFKTNTEFGNLDETKAISTEIAEKENHCSRKRQTLHFNNETEGAAMEFTQSVPAHMLLNLNKVRETQKKQTVNFETNTECGNMDETQGVTTKTTEKENQCSRKRQTLHFNNEAEGATMEFTQSVPAHMLLNPNKVHETHKRQTINFKTNTECGNMDETKAISTEIAEKENQCSKKRQTLHFNNETEGATMEFTQSVPAHMLLNLNKVRETEKRQTVNFETNTKCGNMDETKAISTEIAEKENQYSRKRQTLHFNNETEGATMEFTQSVPAHMLLNLNKIRETQKRQTINFKTNTECGNMDETKAISTEIAEKENQCSSKRETLHFNNETEGAAMEFTHSVPSHVLLNVNKGLQTQKRQTINFKTNTECGNMDETRAISTKIVEKENQCSRKRETLHFNNETEGATMEFTHSVPPHMISNLNKVRETQKRQTINFETNTECGNMDETQGVTTETTEKENQCSRKRQTLHFNNETEGATIEFTQSVPSHVPLNINKGLQTQKRQTINFKTNVERGNMDETQAVPTEIAEKENHCSKKRHTKNEENDSKTTNLQTIHFITETEIVTLTQSLPETTLYNQASSESSMKITESIPADSIKKSLKISKVIQDTLNFSNIPVESDSASIKTVDTYFPVSLKPETEDKAQENLPPVDMQDIPKNRIDHPVILDQNSDDTSDTYHRIKFSEETDDHNVSKTNLTVKGDTTPVKNKASFNLTENLTAILDSTTKIINCESDLPVSEYSKIISDKNYSIVDTSFPDNLEISDVTNDSKNMSHNIPDYSIISVNSSVETEKSVEVPNKNVKQTLLSEIDLIMEVIVPPIEFDYNFNLKEELAKIQKPQVPTKEQQWLREKLSEPRITFAEQIKIHHNIDLDRFNKPKHDTQTLILPQHQFEDKTSKKMFQKLENFKKRLHAEKEKEQPKIKLSLEDKIKRMINKDTLWKLIPNEEFHFTFMGNSVKVITKVDRDSAIVEHVEFLPQVDESTCSPIWIYVHRIQKIKLLEDNIKSAVGQNYTIFTLLDYLTKIGEELMDILEEYDHIQFNIGVKIDRDLNATLLFTNLFLRLAFNVTFNLNNLDNITGNEITVTNQVGSADENALKRLIKHCPPGIKFFREYDRLVKDYLKLLQQSREK